MQHTIYLLNTRPRLLNTYDNFHRTPLFTAVDEHNHSGMVNLLLKHGADPNIPAFGKSMTPLHVACLRHCTEYMELLLSHGADPNFSIYDVHYSPLDQLIKVLGPIECFQLLIDHGVNLNSKQRPPLLLLLEFNVSLEKCKDIARLLIYHGADMPTTGRQYSLYLWMLRHYIILLVLQVTPNDIARLLFMFL